MRPLGSLLILRRTALRRAIPSGGAAAALLGAALLLGCGRGKEADKAGAEAAARPIPVTTVAVAKRDLPIYLDGLGTVTAFKTVTVKPQVDGKLEKVLFREGQEVKRGDLLAQIDARPFLALLHQAEGALARDSAMVQNGKLNLERYTTLRGQNLVSQQQVDDQKAQVGQYEGAIAVDKAQIETARLNVEYSRITSPIDGVTGVRIVDEGNVIRASDQGGLVVITQIDPIAVIFTLPQDDMARLMPRMREGKLAVDAFDRDGGVLLGSGELTVLDNQINQATATLRLKSIFPNPQRKLWPNQFVKARLLLTTKKDAIVIPAAAVQRGPKGTFAYVVSSDMTASPHPLEVELLTGDQALIAKGLAPGEQVVVEGLNQLRPGAKVALRGPEGGGKGKPASEKSAPAGQGGGRP